MTHAYTPGLRVAKRTTIQKKRILPLKGEVLKQAGEKVIRQDIVAKTDLPGNVHTINVVNRLGINPEDIHRYMLKGVGEKISKDETLAESKSFIKWFKTTVPSPIDGTVETISTVTGQVLLREPPRPVEVCAYLDGTVTEILPKEGVVLETVATFIQGIFGIGGETWGPIKFAVKAPSEVLNPQLIDERFRDSVIVAGAFASYQTIKKAIAIGAKGLIVGGIHDGDLKQLLGYDQGVAITGSEQIGITLVLTEGFGEIAMAERTFHTLKEREGAIGSISGATQIRAGVIRPEIIIPFDDNIAKDTKEDTENTQSVGIGDSIRIIRQPYFGKIGIVHSWPSELKIIESGTVARILEVKFSDGTIVTIPRANIELIED